MEIKDKIIWAAIVIGGNSFTWIARQYKPELWKAKTSHNHEWWNINWEGNNVQNDHPWLLRDAHKQLFINRWSGVPTFALVSSIMGMMAVGKCCNCRHGASMVPVSKSPFQLLDVGTSTADLLVVFSNSSSIIISSERQLKLQNAFSPLHEINSTWHLKINILH